MGYKRQAKIYVLEWDEDSEFSGLVVKARGLSMGKFLEVLDLSKNTDQESVNKLFDQFSTALVSWNLEDENDKPVPATKRGINSQDLDLVLNIVTQWVKAIAGVSAPLEQGLNSGNSSLVDSIPMETK